MIFVYLVLIFFYLAALVLSLLFITSASKFVNVKRKAQLKDHPTDVSF